MFFNRRRHRVERPERPVQRRRYLRLPSGRSRGTCSVGEVSLIDVSPMGLGLATYQSSGLELGDRHLIIVEDEKGRSFETLAEIRWTEGPSTAGRYRAGLAFVSVLRDDPGGTWQGIAADPQLDAGESIAWADDLDGERATEEPKPSPVARLDVFRRRRKAKSS